jgi:hypothetical protein
VLDVWHVWLLVHVAPGGGLGVRQDRAERDDSLGHQLSLPLIDAFILWRAILQPAGMLLPGPWLNRL